MAAVAILPFFACGGVSPEAFRSPPPSARPHVWWHWMNGNVTRDGITADIEAMAAVGIGGAQVFDAGLALPQGPVAFASEEWYSMLAHASREAKRLGLELCIANCSGWTSSAGPWITPELSMKFVTNTVARVKGGESFDGVLPVPEETNGFYEDIAVVAFPTPCVKAAIPDMDWQIFRKRGAENAPVLPSRVTEAEAPRASCVPLADVVDLTALMSPDGRLRWNAPDTAAEWTVLRVGYMANGQRNRSATAAGDGLECDKLDAHALDVHFDAYVGEALRRLGPDGALNNVLLDSYEVHGQNWTRGFERTFAERTGYSITPYMPVFAGFPVGDAASTDGFLRDFRRVVSDEFVKNYAARLHERCREKGLLLSCEPYGNGPFNDLAFARHCDVPMSEFWQPYTNGTDLAALARDGSRTFMEARWGNRALGNAKAVSSSAHVWGMRIVGAEACTAYPMKDSGRWLQGPFELKSQIDRVFSEGVNRMVFHRFAHQPWTTPTRWPGMTMGAYGGHFDRTQTWWEHGAKEFFGYLSRVQHMLQQGEFAADVLLCTTGEAPDYGTEGVLPQGYDGDRCHPDALAECRVEGGRVIVPGGVAYRVVGAPPRASLRPETAAALARLEREGATIVEYGGVPGALSCMGVGPDVTCDDRDATWIHRRAGGDDVYFVAVPCRERKTVAFSFRVSGRVPELWNPMDGSVHVAKSMERDGRTEVSLDCWPSHSVFVVFREKTTPDIAEASPPCGPPGAREIPVAGPWRVSFREPGAESDVATTEFAHLGPWTESGNDDIRYFSGTATYETRFALPSDVQGRAVLDLGDVRNIAEVEVNGRAYPALWKPPFAVDVTDSVKPGEKASLKVRVTNYWPNRLIGDARLPDDCEWDDGSRSRGYPMVVDFPEWLLRGGRSPTGRHAFSTCRLWGPDEEPQESGLLGPVVVRVP